METQEIGRLQGKLQAFYDQLEDDEKVIVAGVLLRASAGDDVTGHASVCAPPAPGFTACECAPPAPGFSVPDGAQLSISTNPADPNGAVVIPL